MGDHLSVRHVMIPAGVVDKRQSGTYRKVVVQAGHRGTEHVVPPAGEAHAFDVDRWARRVEVTVSPTGRSVRVFVDGREIPFQPPQEQEA